MFEILDRSSAVSDVQLDGKSTKLCCDVQRFTTDDIILSKARHTCVTGDKLSQGHNVIILFAANSKRPVLKTHSYVKYVNPTFLNSFFDSPVS